MRKILVAGAGGFIGGHLVKDLLKQGHYVRAVDKKPIREWYQVQSHEHCQNIDNLDLRHFSNCCDAVYDMDYVYNLAADMGGMGFIENNKAACMLSVLINTHLLMAASSYKVKRYLFASSACIYPDYAQDSPDVPPLRETDAYPANPEDGYGWEKLFSERMCRHFREDYGLETRIARFHNVYGPYGTYKGGREKAPAALCRKVIEALVYEKNFIEIWGNGEQTRSFMYIDDCIKGVQLIMNGDCPDPINLGSSELVSINELAEKIKSLCACEELETRHIEGPLGVQGRNSDNTKIKQLFNWEPTIPLDEGLQETFMWILGQISASIYETTGSYTFRLSTKREGR